MQQVTISKAILDEPGYLGERFSKPMAWIDLLLLAKDGVVTASFRELSVRWKWSVNKVIRFIRWLQENCSVECSMNTMRGTLAKQSIVIKSNTYTTQRNIDGTFHGTIKSTSPFSPASPSPNPPAPPYIPTTTPPISPSENTHSPLDAPAYARGEETYPPTPFPYPAPFILTSVEKEMCRIGMSTIARVKRQHLAANLSTIAGEYQMDEQEQAAFLDYWCQPLDYNPDLILAEQRGAFDLRYRVKKWTKNIKATEQPQKSRLEQYVDTSQQLTRFINELYGDSSDTGAANGTIVPPDEQ